MMVDASAVVGQPLRVGLFPDIAPYVISTEPQIGIDVDLVLDLGRRLERDIELTMLPPARLSRMLNAGQLDMHMLHGKNGMGCVTTQPLSFWADGITVSEKARGLISTVPDLNGRQVAVYPAGEAFFRSQLRQLGAPEAIVVVIPNTQLMVNMLLRNRVDAMFSELRVTQYLLKLDGATSDVELPQPLMRFADDHRLCIADPDIAVAVDAAIKEQVAEGLFEQLVEKYLGP